mgnify:CR=1 FL=1
MKINLSAFLVFLLLVAASAHAQAYVHPLPQAVENTKIYPLGWSPDGKFAYIYFSNEEDLVDMVFEFRVVVVDLITDEETVVFESLTPPFDAHPDDYIGFETAWDYLAPDFIPLLEEKAIVISDPVLHPLPLSHRRTGDNVLHIHISVSTEQTTMMGFETEYIGSFAVQAINHDGLQKTITRQTNTDTTVGKITAIGAFISPYENRAAILLDLHRFGPDVSPRHRYQIVGCHLQRGFQ